MITLLLLALSIWLLGKAIGLAFKLTWGITKVIASLLMGLAVPLLIVCLIFAGGVALLVPVGMIAAAFGLLKACV